MSGFLFAISPKKKDGGDDKEGVNGGGSQNGETSNGPPMSKLTSHICCSVSANKHYLQWFWRKYVFHKYGSNQISNDW